MMTPIYNNTQKYFLVSNLAVTFAWLFVLVRFLILFPLTGTRFLPGGITDFYLVVLGSTILVEVFNYITIFRFLPSNTNASSSFVKPNSFVLLVNVFERLNLIFIILNYPKITRNISFSVLIFAQSNKEIIRWFYSFQKVKLFNSTGRLLSVLKKLTFTVLAPIITISEVALLFNSLIFGSYYPELTEYDDKIKIYLKAAILLYSGCSYIIYKRKIICYFFRNFGTKSEKIEKID